MEKKPLRTVYYSCLNFSGCHGKWNIGATVREAVWGLLVQLWVRFVKTVPSTPQ